LKLLIFKQRF